MVGFPFSRSRFSFGGLFAFAVDAFRREWMMLSLAIIVVGVISVLASGLSSGLSQIGVEALDGMRAGASWREAAAALGWIAVGLVVGLGLQFVAQGFAVMGFYRVLLDVLDGQKADLARLFSQGRKVGRYVSLNIVLSAITLGPMGLICLVAFGGWMVGNGLSLSELSALRWKEAMGPGLVVAVLGAVGALSVFSLWTLPLWIFSIPELVVSDGPLGEVLERAWRLGAGVRGTTFAYLFAAQGVVLAGLMLCCVGAIPAAAIASLLQLSFFLALRGDPAFPPREGEVRAAGPAA